MALSQHTVTVPLKGGSLRKTGSATWDSTEAAALLIGAIPTTSDEALTGSGTTARASIDTGVVTVQVDAPLTAAGDVDVLVTIDA